MEDRALSELWCLQVEPDPDAVVGALRSRAGATRHGTGRTAAQTSQSAGEAARRAAGPANQTSSLTIAPQTTQDAAAEDLASADAQMSKPRLLRRTGPKDGPGLSMMIATLRPQ